VALTTFNTSRITQQVHIKFNALLHMNRISHRTCWIVNSIQFTGM